MLDKKSRILIVDDFEVVRMMLKSVLDGLGYHATEFAEDGAIAMKLMKKAQAESNPFVLVFTDWNMPNMTGIELLQECREDAALSKIPIVMITAESEQDQVIQALRAGAVEYIVKPFSRDALKKKLEKLSKRIVGG